ncbi:36145_t:CDS:1, partial [Racocetra persica]
RLEKGPNTLTKEENQEKATEEPEQEDDSVEKVKKEKPDAFLLALNAVND